MVTWVSNRNPAAYLHVCGVHLKKIEQNQVIARFLMPASASQLTNKTTLWVKRDVAGDWSSPLCESCGCHLNQFVGKLLILLYMGVSENSGTPKSSILIGFSIRNHPFWGTSIFGNAHIIPKHE